MPAGTTSLGGLTRRRRRAGPGVDHDGPAHLQGSQLRLARGDCGSTCRSSWRRRGGDLGLVDRLLDVDREHCQGSQVSNWDLQVESIEAAAAGLFPHCGGLRLYNIAIACTHGMGQKLNGCHALATRLWQRAGRRGTCGADAVAMRLLSLRVSRVLGVEAPVGALAAGAVCQVLRLDAVVSVCCCRRCDLGKNSARRKIVLCQTHLLGGYSTISLTGAQGHAWL